jgi:hypothetical protein
MMSNMKMPTGIKVIIVIELFIALLGFATGFSLISDPSGVSLGLNVLKDKIPFQNLFLLGLWFVGPYGLLPAVIAYGFFKRKLWAWRPALYLAIVEVVWVLVQIPMVGRSYLQAMIGGIALLTIYFLYRPSSLSFINYHKKSGEIENDYTN